jgi:hypothetical protein
VCVCVCVCVRVCVFVCVCQCVCVCICVFVCCASTVFGVVCLSCSEYSSVHYLIHAYVSGDFHKTQSIPALAHLTDDLFLQLNLKHKCLGWL